MNDIEEILVPKSENSAYVDVPNSEVIAFQESFGKISKLALQMSASYTTSFQLVTLVYFLSQLDNSEDNIAAISLITSMINTVLCIGLSPLFSISLVAGNEIGELRNAEASGEDESSLIHRREQISGALRNGLIISSVMTAPMIVSLVCSKSILIHVFQQNKTVASITGRFLAPYAIMVPAALLRTCSEQIMFAFERTKPAMMIGVSNFIICTSIGSVLAFGVLSAPKLNESGILIGCVAESYLTSTAYTLYLAKSSRLQRFNFMVFSKPLAPDLTQLKNILKLGKPIFIAITIEAFSDLLIPALAGIVGTNEQAALTAILQFSLFSILLQMAFGQTCAQEISRLIGEKQYVKANQAAKYGLLTTLTYTTPIPLALAIYPSVLMRVIGTQNESIEVILRHLAPIMFTACILNAARFNLLQQLRVLEDAKTSTLISSNCLLLGLGLAALLGLKSKMGVYGIATGYATGISLATVLLFYRWIPRIQPKAINENKQNSEKVDVILDCCPRFFNRCQREPAKVAFGTLPTQEKKAFINNSGAHVYTAVSTNPNI